MFRVHSEAFSLGSASLPSPLHRQRNNVSIHFLRCFILWAEAVDPAVFISSSRSRGPAGRSNAHGPIRWTTRLYGRRRSRQHDVARTAHRLVRRAILMLCPPSIRNYARMTSRGWRWTTPAARDFGWHIEMSLPTILEDIAQHANNHPDWLG